MEIAFKPGDAILGALSEADIRQTFDLYHKLFLPHSFGEPLRPGGWHYAPKDDEKLKHLTYIFGCSDRIEGVYEARRALHWHPKGFEMGGVNDSASWSVILSYSRVHQGEESDIEAMFKTYKKNGKWRGDVQGSFKLSEIKLIDNLDDSNQFEIEFSRVRHRLVELNEIKSSGPQGSKLEASSDEQIYRGSWVDSMISKGYEEGPLLSDFDKLLKWEKHNTRAHIRSRISNGYQIFFVDRSESRPLEKVKDSTNSKNFEIDDSEIPF